MRRTTVYLESETDLLLKQAAARRRQPVAELIREALDEYVKRGKTRLPRGVAAFDSGHADTAERAEEILEETGFGSGQKSGQPKRRSRRGRSRKA